MKRIIISLLLIASAAPQASNIQSLELLRDKIEAFIINEIASSSEGKIQVLAEKIDPRLTLKECPDDQILIFNPYQTPILSSTTMGVKCNDASNHWTLYVPVRISLLKPVYVAKKAMIKGTVVTEDDIYQAELDVQRLKQGYFTESATILGQVCKQNVAADSPLNPYNIELAKVVRKGQEVTIVAANEGMVISMSGVAMSDGALGEIVKVKNLSSKKIIEAQVSGERKVKIAL